MSNDEVKKSITSQVRMVFFLPIILAACHLAAAFPLLRRLLVMFNLTDIKLIAICMSATFWCLWLYTILFQDYFESILQDCGKPDLGVSYEL